MNRPTLAEEAARLEAELRAELDRIEADLEHVRRRWPRLFRAALVIAVGVEVARDLGRQLVRRA